MNKHEKAVRNYVLNKKSFTWESDIIENVLWGFKNAPCKSLATAQKVVRRVISDMTIDRMIVVTAGERNYQATIERLA